MHGHFEIMSAMASEIRNKGTVKAWEGTIVSQIIPIDQSFVEKYVTGLFAELRAGDMVYLAVAAVDRLPLVTADEKLRRVALSKGVAAFSAEEFLVHLKGAGSD
jgi:predicted nucleic acid-binding protein